MRGYAGVMAAGWGLWLTAAAAATAVAAQATPAPQVPPAELRRHLVSVLTRSEYGDHRRAVVRWQESPRLAILGGDEVTRLMAQEVAAELSALLSAAAGLAIVPVDDPAEATMRLYLGSREALAAAAMKEGFQYIPGNNAMFWASWDSRGVISRATILLSEDPRRPPAHTRHLLLEELTQSLGMMNDSDRFPESVVFETERDFGSATTLGFIDQQTLLLLYGHLSPGARACQVRWAYRKYWGQAAALSGPARQG